NRVDCGSATLAATGAARAGAAVAIALRPERIRLDPTEAVDSVLAMTVAHVVYQGETARYILTSDAGCELQALDLREVRSPAGADQILVTRLADGSAVFVGKSKMISLIEARIAALEERGVALNVLLCTGEFPKLAARRPFLEPQQLLLGLLRAMVFPGRLGV